MANKYRVLIVNKNPDVCAELERLLTSTPTFEIVGYASSGAQAIELAHMLQPDRVVMDNDLPDMSGVDATQELSGTNLKLRVILTTTQTGLSTIEFQRRAFRAGVVDIVELPTTSDELWKAVVWHIVD